jgi:multiple sugar transport system permease protein
MSEKNTNFNLKMLGDKKHSQEKVSFGYYLLLTVVAFFMVIPLVWMISTSLKNPADVFIYPPKWIPDYRYIIEDGNKVAVNITDEYYNVEYITGSLKGTTELVSKGNIDVQWRNWWSPWDKAKLVNTSKNKDFPRWDEVKVLNGIATIETISQKEGVYSYDKKEIDIKKVYRGIKPIWKNYATVIEVMPFMRFYWNSFIVSVAVTLGQVLTSAMAAYSFSRLNFPGRDKLFLGYLATMMIPYAVVLVPVYILMNWLDWVDTYKALIIPGMFSAYGTFMLRQFFMTIPVDLEDAAKIDGCNFLRIFWNIILPLSKPALATLTVFTLLGSWMNFMWPLIVTNSVPMKTLPVGLAYFQETGFGTQYELLMAGAFMAIIPLVIIFVFTQRFFVEGIKMQGLKG